MADDGVVVAVATPIEDELVERIRQVDSRVEVLWDPSLVAPARWASDHNGDPDFSLDEDGRAGFEEMLARADVVLGYPGDSPEGLSGVLAAAPRARWVAGMSAGAGQHVAGAELSAEQLERVAVTTSSGAHAGPLAEFSLMGLLYFAKHVPELLSDQREKRWPDTRRPVRELTGQTMLIVGLGEIGVETARLAKQFGMRVVGVKRTPGEVEHVDEVHGNDRLEELVAEADAIVVTLPITPATEGLLSGQVLAAVKPGAVLTSVGRGAVIDEGALVERLRDGTLAGAALDVFESEPLAADSPLWELPNVIVSPHVSALSELENTRIVELFVANLERFLAGEPLEKRVTADTPY